MKPKYKLGEEVEFDGINGEIIEIIEYDLDDFDLTPSYKIKVNAPAMSCGFCIMGRAEEEISAISTQTKKPIRSK